MATATLISQHRDIGCEEKRVTMLVTPNNNGAAQKVGGVGPYWLEPAQTIILDTDNAGGETITFDAAAGSVETSNLFGGIANQVGLTVTVNCYPYDPQLVTFAGATTDATLIAAEFNNQLVGCHATVEAGPEVRITCDQFGTDADVTITAGTSAITWDAAIGGTGDVADIHAVTADEVVTMVLADTAVTEAYLVNDRFLIMSPTAGLASELDFTGGTALAALGLAVETLTGTAGAGAGYVANGEPIDLTPYFPVACYGGRIISANGLAGGAYKWDIICDPTAVPTANNVTLGCHKQLDPGNAGGADVFFSEETARLPHAVPLMIEFWGV